MNVEFASGSDRLRGALYLPEENPGDPRTRRPRPGVIVVHDVWGLYDPYHGAAQRLARAGFVALALDLYSRGEKPGTPADMPAVMRFLDRLPDRRVLSDIGAAVAWLRSRPEVAGRKVGLTGFCMGGKYACLAAVRCAGLSAVVSWYGLLHADAIDEANPEHAKDALQELAIPLLALFGSEDVFIPLAEVEELRAKAASRGLPLETVVYTGAGHAFANESRAEAFRPEAAADAWRRAIAFLSRELEG